MTSSVLNSAGLCLAALGAHVALSTPALAQADLRPIVDRVRNGVVVVRNMGNQPSLATRVELRCATNCPNDPAMAAFDNGNGGLEFDVPALAPDARERIAIPGWANLAWTPGNYTFTVSVDNFLSPELNPNELNEDNNVDTLVWDPTAAAPDLRANLQNIQNGEIIIRNAGRVDAPASVVSLDCEVVSGGAPECPDTPAVAAGVYWHPAFAPAPRIGFDAPVIPAGQSVTIAIPFWSGLSWQPGEYRFIAEADAANGVSEELEDNNIRRRVVTLP